MHEVDRIVIRPSRVLPALGVGQALFALLSMIAESQGIFDGNYRLFALAFGLFWLGHYALCSITVTDELVVVRRGMFTDLHRSDAVLRAATEAHRIPFAVGASVFRNSFMVRPGLIAESIEQVRGGSAAPSQPSPREPLFNGRVRSATSASP